MRVLLVSSEERDLEFFSAAAKAASLPFLKVASPEQACSELKSNPTALVIVDASTEALYGAFERCVDEKLGLFSESVNSNNFFFVATCEFQEAPYLVRSEIFGNFIHRSFTEIDIPLIGRLFATAASGQAFGVEKYVGPESKIQTIKITKSGQKKSIVESLKAQLFQIGFKTRMATIIATATDELIMNAIFDAPVDEAGKHIYSQTPRSAALDLVEKNEVEMKIAFDGALLGISMLDHHGSLNKKKLLGQHLGKSYASDEYKTVQTSAGAGLGLANVYRNCGGIIFSCENSECTEVNLFYRKLESFKDFKDQFRFLSTFMYFS